jgi:hypothetical protein
MTDIIHNDAERGNRVAALEAAVACLAATLSLIRVP